MCGMSNHGGGIPPEFICTQGGEVMGREIHWGSTTESGRMRAGVTLLEVVVVIAIIGLLASILLPAIQAIRATACKMSCAHRQRQLALAIANYAETHSVLPSMTTEMSDPSSCLPESAISRLFPYLELGSVCQILQANVFRLPIFECPSDGEISVLKTPLSFVFNESPGMNAGSLARGPFHPDGIVRMADVTDGLSNTAAICESIAVRSGGSSADADRNPIRYPWTVFVPAVLAFTIADPTSPASLADRASQTDLSIEDCMNDSRDFHARQVPVGSQWGERTFGGVSCTYSHWLPPNAPFCTAASSSTADIPFLSWNRRSASNHAGGVNVTFLDGHQRFISNSLDLKVWRAAGTRNGNEVAGELP